jgi:hypothetical protein
MRADHDLEAVKPESRTADLAPRLEFDDRAGDSCLFAASFI